MEALSVILDLEQQGLREGQYAVTEYNGQLTIGAMSKGTTGGKPVVMVALEDPETGGFIVAQTTLSLFLTAADAMKARHGDPRT